MPFSEYASYDAMGLAELVQKGETSAEELADSAIAAIEATNPQVNAVNQILPEMAKEEIKAGLADGPFKGVPFLIKEFGMHAKGIVSNMGSKLGEGIVFDDDTELMRRFRQAGLVTVGTTTTPEMAFNASSEAVLYGPTSTPWNTGHSAGGSSGGAGSAVAAGMVPMAHANDGGGSIRIPAACNGLVGMKPSRGRTPHGPDLGILLFGLGIEFAVTRTVRDSAALLDAIHGADPGAFMEAPAPKGTFLDAVAKRPTLTIGVLDRFPHQTQDLEPEIADKLAETVKLLESLGHTVRPVSIDYDVEDFNHSSAVIWATTLSYFMDQFAAATGRGINNNTCEAVTLEVYKFGQTLKATDVEAALVGQNKVSRAVGNILTGVDVILTPGLVRDPAPLGELNQNAPGVDMAKWWAQIIGGYSAYTPAINTSGHPAVMLPLFQSQADLPMAMQFIGRMGAEETLYSLSGQLEEALPWKDRRPPVYA